MAKDDFYPTRDVQYFVAPTSLTPITTARMQLQVQVQSTRPLIYFGRFGGIGLVGQVRESVYGTGDSYDIGQAGPNVSVIVGPFYNQVTYLYGRTGGHTPFVFDAFYQGQNYLQTINSVQIGKLVTIGALHGLNLDRSTADNSLVIAQEFFISIGNRNIKFAIGYDAIVKRSSFGLVINPEGGQTIMDFHQLNILQPKYDPNDQVIAASTVVAPHRKFLRHHRSPETEDQPDASQNSPSVPYAPSAPSTPSGPPENSPAPVLIP